MYKEDEYTELKSILTKDIKKEIVELSSMIKEGIISDLTVYTNIKE